MTDAMQIRNAEYAKLLEYEGKRWLLEDYLFVTEERDGVDCYTLANGEQRYCWPTMWDAAVECVCEWPLTEKTQGLSQKESTQKARGEVDEIWRTYKWDNFPVEFCQAVGMWKWMTNMQLNNLAVLEVPEDTEDMESLTEWFYNTLDRCALQTSGAQYDIPEGAKRALRNAAYTVFPLWFGFVEQY